MSERELRLAEAVLNYGTHRRICRVFYVGTFRATPEDCDCRFQAPYMDAIAVLSEKVTAEREAQETRA